MKRKDYMAPHTELLYVNTESMMNPISVTENGQTSPHMGIGGDSPGNQDADAKQGFFEYEFPSCNSWDD